MRSRSRRTHADALLARARRHLGGDLEVRVLLLDAVVLNGEDGEVVHRHIVNVVDIRNSQRAAREEVVVDFGRKRVARLFIESLVRRRRLEERLTDVVRPGIGSRACIERRTWRSRRVAVGRKGIMTGNF